jgi:hypothetical protein
MDGRGESGMNDLELGKRLAIACRYATSKANPDIPGDLLAKMQEYDPEMADCFRKMIGLKT